MLSEIYSNERISEKFSSRNLLQVKLTIPQTIAKSFSNKTFSLYTEV